MLVFSVRFFPKRSAWGFVKSQKAHSTVESYSPSHVGFFPPLLSWVILSVGTPILQHLSSSPSLPHSCSGQLWPRPLALAFGAGFELSTEEAPDGVPLSAQTR